MSQMRAAVTERQVYYNKTTPRPRGERLGTEKKEEKAGKRAQKKNEQESIPGEQTGLGDPGPAWYISRRDARRKKNESDRGSILTFGGHDRKDHPLLSSLSSSYFNLRLSLVCIVPSSLSGSLSGR